MNLQWIIVKSTSIHQCDYTKVCRQYMSNDLDEICKGSQNAESGEIRIGL